MEDHAVIWACYKQLWAQIFLKWSTVIQSSLPRTNILPVSSAYHVPGTWACHEDCDNYVLQPRFVQLCWICQSVDNQFGVQKPTVGKLVIEASEAVSKSFLFQIVPLRSIESLKHHPPCLEPFAGFLFLPCEFSLYLLKEILLLCWLARPCGPLRKIYWLHW